MRTVAVNADRIGNDRNGWIPSVAVAVPLLAICSTCPTACSVSAINAFDWLRGVRLPSALVCAVREYLGRGAKPRDTASLIERLPERPKNEIAVKRDHGLGDRRR